ncbi:MAG: type III-A CRISPR-associated protein Csm2, partial [Epulopiscium sp. Nele67-Bin001]
NDMATNNKFNGNPHSKNNGSKGNYSSKAPTTDGVLKFFDEGLRKDGKLRPEILMTDANIIANKIADSRESRSQLRAFYSECKGVEYKMTNEESFNNHSQDIWMLKAKAAYRYRNGMKDGKIKEPLYNLISKGVDYVAKENTYESFRDFMKLFEAVVGYSYNTAIRE